jgi:hypothetical protein
MWFTPEVRREYEVPPVGISLLLQIYTRLPLPSWMAGQIVFRRTSIAHCLVSAGGFTTRAPLVLRQYVPECLPTHSASAPRHPDRPGTW